MKALVWKVEKCKSGCIQAQSMSWLISSHLIHVSAFINPETGHLVLLDENGGVVQDSTKIIYPGSGSNAWWDCKQLLRQMEDTIQIFEAAHPGKQSLFSIFDQSSVHASLPDDALKAFKMNQSDGGKQWKQLLQLFFLVLTISLFSSMDDALLIPKRFRSMPLHASSSWHVSITYMPSTSCSPSISHAYYLMPNDLIPCLSLIIYTLLVICTPCLFRIIYIHTPYAFHTLTMLFLVYKRL